MRVLLIKTSSLGDVIHTLPALTDAARALNRRADTSRAQKNNQPIESVPNTETYPGLNPIEPSGL